MRKLLLSIPLALVLPLAACEIDPLGIGSPDEPTNLTYQLMPSGDPDVPLGVVLTWEPPSNGEALTYEVYGRSATSGDWSRRATTTSPSFHDAGIPQLQYYVAAHDEEGREMGRSDIVTIDERNRLPAPQSLTSVSLNRAIHLTWSDNAVDADPEMFDHYRVYSSSYTAGSGVCTDDWSLEGTTVSDGFLSANLPNGAARCFAVSAVSKDGHESAWSSPRLDTPRYDARNVLVHASSAQPQTSGFLFYDEIAHAYGVVGSDLRVDNDLVVERHVDGSLWFRPARTGVQMALYSTSSVTDLTSIDRAPASGFADVTIEAVPGYAYVIRTQKSDGVHFGGLRVAFVGADYVVFDWSYQSAAGNPELSRIPSTRVAP
jgi:hypothetical protein